MTFASACASSTSRTSTLAPAAGEIDELGFARWIAGGDAPRGTEPSWRDRVL